LVLVYQIVISRGLESPVVSTVFIVLNNWWRQYTVIFI
jgi:hypothetical protein